jgi:hypothetical protein
MRSIRKIALAAAVLLTAAATQHPAAAQGYPRLSGSGDEAVIDYGPGLRNNLVGGGRVALGHDGDSIAALRLDRGIAQETRFGQVPVARTENGNLEVVLVPAAPAAATFAAAMRGPGG